VKLGAGLDQPKLASSGSDGGGGVKGVDCNDEEEEDSETEYCCRGSASSLGLATLLRVGGRSGVDTEGGL
jgi:hypothetical protein